jgi:HlyD family secretion protein
LSLPAAAVVRRGQLAFVFVEDDGLARLRPVTLGATFGDRVEVLAGVGEGAAVVVRPPPSLTDGAPVSRGGGV